MIGDGGRGERDSVRLRPMSSMRVEGRGRRMGKRNRSLSTVLGREYWSGHYKLIGVGMEQGEEDIIHSNEEKKRKTRSAILWRKYCQWASGWQVEEGKRHRRYLGTWLWTATIVSDWMIYSPITAMSSRFWV